MTAPEGFKRLKSDSPFVELIGSFYFKEETSSYALGFTVEEKHCNSNGNIHGGMIATIVDMVLGNNLGIANTPIEIITKYQSDGVVPDVTDLPKLVTVNLSIDYLGRANVGDWLEIRAKTEKVGSALSFASANVQRNGKSITSASGIYRNLQVRNQA